MPMPSIAPPPADLAEVGSDKWTRYPGCIGAFIAEMDYGLAAVHPAGHRQRLRPLQTRLHSRTRGSAAWREACAGWQKSHYGWDVDPDIIRVVPDVLEALRDFPARAGRRRQCRGRADARVHAVPERAEAVRRRRDRNRNASGEPTKRPASANGCSISTPSNARSRLAAMRSCCAIRTIRSARCLRWPRSSGCASWRNGTTCVFSMMRFAAPFVFEGQSYSVSDHQRGGRAAVYDRHQRVEVVQYSGHEVRAGAADESGGR